MILIVFVYDDLSFTVRLIGVNLLLDVDNYKAFLSFGIKEGTQRWSKYRYTYLL